MVYVRGYFLFILSCLFLTDLSAYQFHFTIPQKNKYLVSAASTTLALISTSLWYTRKRNSNHTTEPEIDGCKILTELGAYKKVSDFNLTFDIKGFLDNENSTYLINIPVKDISHLYTDITPKNLSTLLNDIEQTKEQEITTEQHTTTNDIRAQRLDSYSPQKHKPLTWDFLVQYRENSNDKWAIIQGLTIQVNRKVIPSRSYLYITPPSKFKLKLLTFLQSIKQKFHTNQ